MEFKLIDDYLEDAYGSLVSARKIAALNDLPEYEEIGKLIDNIEKIIENLYRKNNRKSGRL
jgi:hypothetical protein